MSFSESLFTPGRPFLLRDQSLPSALGGVAITREAAGAFEFEKRWELATTLQAGQSFTATLKGERLAQLDDAGLVRRGTQVRPGMVLVGRIAARAQPAGQPRDASLRCGQGVAGVVAQASIGGEEARVVVTAPRPLRIGDRLELDDGSSSVVTVIVESLDGADLAWPGRAGNFLVGRMSCAVDVLEARSIGPYSLVTQQPLAGRENYGGQRVGPAELDALRRRGARWTIHELLTLKCDDVGGRTRLYEALVKCEEVPASGLPRSTRVLERELRSLGFDVDFTQPSVTVKLFAEATVRAEMPGVVLKPETLNYRTLKPEPGGLFCEELFGGFEGGERAVKMARLELSAPVLHPWARHSAAELLKVSETQLEEVLEGKVALDGSEPEDWQHTGPSAIRAALDGLKLPEQLCPSVWPVLPPDLRPIVPIDGNRFATSDLNDLYRRLINRNNRLRRLLELTAPDIILRNEANQLQLAVDALVENGARHRAITGPNQRPLLALADMVLGARGRLSSALPAKRCDYSGAAQVVPLAGLGEWEATVPRDLMLEVLKPQLYGMLEQQGHVTTIREAKRRVEERTPEALDACEKLAPYQPVLLMPLGADLPEAGGFDVVLWDEPVIGLSPVALERLGAGLGRVMLLLPLDERAKAEARGTLREPPLRPVESGRGGWLKRVANADDGGQALFAAARAGEVDPVEDEYTRMLLGRPPE